MAELLLELFSEEIPAGMQKNAASSLRDNIITNLEKSGIKDCSSNVFYTPRRIAVVISNIPEIQGDSSTETRGPRVGAPENAITGFLKSTGLTIDQLEKRNTDKGEFYFAVKQQKGAKTIDILPSVLSDSISSLTWPKSMKWGNHDIRWVRPLHSILCLFDGHTVPFNFGHIKSGNITRGHRFLSKSIITVKDFADYKQQLKNNFVILDREERKKIITDSAQKIAHEYSSLLKHDDDLLDEVSGLVEWPVVLLGKIEERFMGVPQEVLITAMRSHQKYFSLTDKQGKLAPYFITVANINASDAIIHGNEKVLRARLEDAKFFWDQDRKDKLESHLPKQEKIIFHAKLGTVKAKTDRIETLAKFIAVWIPHANLQMVERSAKLCKADLATQMVGEFPELQGLMGSYYATAGNEDKAIADAIRDHYKPVGPNDICPSAPVSICVALADKIDTIAGLFSIDEKPTGSKDPYALRRAAIGVIRIILENNLRIPLKLLFEKAIAKYPKTIFKGEKQGKLLLRKKGEKPQDKQQRTINEMLEFFADRLRVVLKDKNIRHDVINAVFDSGSEDDFTRLTKRAEVLQSFLETEDGKNLLAAYKRATNIVVAEEKKDTTSYKGDVDIGMLSQEEEKNLSDKFKQVKPIIISMTKEENYDGIMQQLSNLRAPIDSFFDKVIVNCDDTKIRKNRLILLSKFREELDQIASFGEL